MIDKTKQLRELPLIPILDQFGLTQDRNDKNQFIGDNFRISLNGEKWFNHDQQIGGGGALDLVMHLKKCSFREALAVLSTCDFSSSASDEKHPEKTRTEATKPPKPYIHHNKKILAYLTEKRGLNTALVEWCIAKGLIYADARLNCVFRYGENGAELRGTQEKKWCAFYGQKERLFMLPAHESDGVAITESAIDALSYRQQHKTRITVSIAGNSTKALMIAAFELAKYKHLPVYAAVDNDDGGEIAMKQLKQFAAEYNIELIDDRPLFKDWNEQINY